MANLSNINNKLIVTDGGNLLVNKTAANNAAVGVQLMSTGDVNGTVSGDTVARFNRLGTDGEIIRFQHDTSTDGAINSLSGRIAIGSGNTGIFFDSIRQVVTPHNMTTNGNEFNNISFGRNLIRFKDVYLSGRVMAGTGTTAAASLNAFTQTVSANLYSALRIVENSAASSYWDIGAIGGGQPDLNFYVNAGTTPKLTIQATGDVGIGDTNPAYRLSVKKVNAATPAITVSGAFYGGPRIQTYGLDADADAWMGLGTDMAGLAYEHSIYFSNKASTGQGVLTIGSYNGTTYSTKMAVWNNGNIGIGTGTSTVSYKLDVTGTIRATGDVIAYSDRRVKENIKTIDNALSKVLKLRGVSYNRKDIDDKSTKIGVIAQEVLETIPEVVEKDLEGKYSVAYGNMAGLFIEAIKELKAEIEELKKCKCDCKR